MVKRGFLDTHAASEPSRTDGKDTQILAVFFWREILQIRLTSRTPPPPRGPTLNRFNEALSVINRGEAGKGAFGVGFNQLISTHVDPGKWLGSFSRAHQGGCGFKAPLEAMTPVFKAKQMSLLHEEDSFWLPPRRLLSAANGLSVRSPCARSRKRIRMCHNWQQHEAPKLIRCCFCSVLLPTCVPSAQCWLPKGAPKRRWDSCAFCLL